MEDVEKGLHSLHEQYSLSGQAEKDIEAYEANLDRQRAEKKQKEVEEALKIEKEKAAIKQLNKVIPIPFVEITEVMKNSPAFEGGKTIECY